MAINWEDGKRHGLLLAIVLIGAATMFPFIVNLYRLLNVGGEFTNVYTVLELAVRGSLAIGAAGLVLCVLILFYRLRGDESSPSLTSGLILIAIGAALTGLVVISTRGQQPPVVGPHPPVEARTGGATGSP